jgi:hypothetical protein
LFKVKYYRNTRNFYENLTLMSDELHLTQSASLAEYLKVSKQSSAVFAYKYMQTVLFSDWYHPHTEVYIRSVIRDFLISKTRETQYAYLRKHIDDFYKSVMYLIEMGGVKLHDFNNMNLSGDQTLLIDIMDMLQRDTIVQKYYHKRASLNTEEIKQTLNLGSNIRKVYIHHFDYIDGPRMMFFHLLASLGLEVNFCIPFNPEQPELYKTWESIYQSVTGIEADSWECIENSHVSKGSAFASYLRQKKFQQRDYDLANLNFMEFDHPTHFKEFLDSRPIKKNVHDVIAIYDEELNIFTDQKNSRHFYATPYGKFFLALQNVKKTSEGIFCDYDDYVNLMISGWVQAGNVNGQKALTMLVDLKGYMDGTGSITEILERLQALVEFQEISHIFDDMGKEQSGKNRIKRYLSNPFRAYPLAHISRYDITVKQLIECTKDLGRKLNSLILLDGEKRNVQAYVLEIEKMFLTVKDNWDAEAAEKLQNLFRANLPIEWSFRQEELFQLLSFYLGSDKNNFDKIQNFDQLVGIALSSNKIHVTGLSYTSFPWKNPDLPVLINHTWLKKCITKSYISKNKEIRLNSLLVDYYSRKLTRNRALYGIFHLIAYSEGELTFSYIDHLRENDGPSIYLTILKELYDSTFLDEVISDEEELDWPEADDSEERIPLQVFEGIPDLNWLDNDFCSRKFFLNSFIEQHPVYEQDFHQQIVFSTIGKLLSEQGDGEKEVREVLFPLFPQWTNAHKHNLLDITKVAGLRSYKSFENIYYPKAMSRIQRLFSRYEVGENWKAKYQYDHDRLNLEQNVEDFLKKTSKNDVKVRSGHHCRMCPYLHVCEKGEFVIDASDS